MIQDTKYLLVGCSTCLGQLGWIRIFQKNDSTPAPAGSLFLGPNSYTLVHEINGTLAQRTNTSNLTITQVVPQNLTFLGERAYL
jgi:hypothetical protein